MPRFLEEKLKREYPNNPHAVFGTMNKLGAMHGNKETAKGRAMQVKHDRDMSHARTHPARNLGGHLHPKRSR
ncbi:MAG TPA: hypothetical protein VK504_06075 [Vicinamibacterales bacterium]|nr:hypothetical protein [Vicinamibacterales bacterium]